MSYPIWCCCQISGWNLEVHSNEIAALTFCETTTMSQCTLNVHWVETSLIQTKMRPINVRMKEFS